MTNKRVSLDIIRENYDSFIDACAKFDFYTRSKRIQKAKLKECEQYLQVLKGYKYQAIEKNDEHAANLLFHFQCMVNSMTSSLNMWLSLKADDYHEAWCHLIDSQEYIEVSLKIADYPGIRNFESQLKAMEAALFPGWALYNSPGHTETIGKCSICASPFLECEHIENNIYMGRLCQRVDRNIIEAHHSALVKNPKDRRCIITKVSGDNGKMIDYFTWEEMDDGRKDDGNNYFEGVVLSFHNLDFN